MPAIEHKLNVTEEEIPEHIRRVAEAQGECPQTKKETIAQFRNYIAGMSKDNYTFILDNSNLIIIYFSRSTKMPASSER